MKRAYEKPHMEVTLFRFSEHIAASGGPTPICYPIYSNVDTTGDNICDGTAVYQGRTNV